MKVLMTADTVGGVFTYAVELCRAYAAAGVEVILLTRGKALSASQRSDLGALRNVRVHETELLLEWQDAPWHDVRRADGLLLELAARERPDIVHLNDYAHGQLRFNCPKVVVGHSCVTSWFEAVKGQPLPEEWKRYRSEVSAGLRGADAVVAPSGAMLDSLLRHYGPLRRAAVIHNGRLPLAPPYRQKEPLVFSAGRLWDEAKNIAAVEAVAPLLDWPVRVAGDASGLPPPHAKLKRLGVLSSAEIAGWLSRAAIYALPARYEPFGLSVLEAALARCALVLGDIPSLRELWDGAAVFVRPDDRGGLAYELNALIADSRRREELAHAAQVRAQRFTPARMAREYLELYRSLRAGEGVSTCAS